MPANLELKARLSSESHGMECARRAGAEDAGLLVQEDTYFLVPRGRLKLREIAGQQAELIRYDRRESADARWSSYEKIPVGDPGALKGVLGAALTIHAVVRKTRHLFLHKGARVHIDVVEGLGTFLEFEVPASEGLDPVAHMQELRIAFNVDEGSILRCSYADFTAVAALRS